MPDHLSLPDKNPSPRQDEQSNSAYSVEDVRNAHRSDPSRHGEDENRAEQVSQESERGERVADNFCKQVSISGIFKRDDVPLNLPL